jgi:hypothetical protein
VNRGQVADIIGRSALSPYQKLVLLCYMSHLPSAAAIGSGVAWPGLQTLASWASCSRSTAQAARAQLLEAGILVAVERSEVAMKCRLNLVALAAWAPEEGGAARRQGAATRHGGVPPAGTGGAATRHGGVPPAGTEPSSDNPPKQPSKENLDGAGAPALSLRKEEETRTTSGTSTSQPGEAERLFERLERLRAERQAQLGRPARPSRPEIWVPKLRKALKTFGGAGAVEDAWVWLLKAPGAAWHRGEDGKGPDRTVDFATLLAHPEYAEKRDWKGPLGPTKQEIQEELAWLDGDGRPEDEPAWRQRRAAVGADHGLRDRGQREAGAEGPAAAAADAWVCPF